MYAHWVAWLAGWGWVELGWFGMHGFSVAAVSWVSSGGLNGGRGQLKLCWAGWVPDAGMVRGHGDGLLGCRKLGCSAGGHAWAHARVCRRVVELSCCRVDAGVPGSTGWVAGSSGFCWVTVWLDHSGSSGFVGLLPGSLLGGWFVDRPKTTTGSGQSRLGSRTSLHGCTVPAGSVPGLHGWFGGFRVHGYGVCCDWDPQVSLINAILPTASNTRLISLSHQVSLGFRRKGRKKIEKIRGKLGTSLSLGSLLLCFSQTVGLKRRRKKVLESRI